MISSEVFDIFFRIFDKVSAIFDMRSIAICNLMDSSSLNSLIELMSAFVEPITSPKVAMVKKISLVGFVQPG